MQANLDYFKAILGPYFLLNHLWWLQKEMEAISYWTAEELRENMKYLFSQLEVVINSLLKTTASPQFTTIRRHFEQASGR